MACYLIKAGLCNSSRPCFWLILSMFAGIIFVQKVVYYYREPKTKEKLHLHLTVHVIWVLPHSSENSVNKIRPVIGRLLYSQSKDYFNGSYHTESIESVSAYREEYNHLPTSYHFHLRVYGSKLWNDDIPVGYGKLIESSTIVLLVSNTHPTTNNKELSSNIGSQPQTLRPA